MKHYMIILLLLLVVACVPQETATVKQPVINVNERMVDIVFKNPDHYASYSFTQVFESDIYSDTREVAVRGDDYFESNSFTGQEVKQVNFYLIEGTSYNCVLKESWECLEFPEKNILSQEEKETAIRESRNAFMQLDLINEPSKLIVDTQARCFSFNLTNFTVKECYSSEGVLLYQKNTYENNIVKSEELVANFYSLSIRDDIFELPAMPTLITIDSEVAK